MTPEDKMIELEEIRAQGHRLLDDAALEDVRDIVIYIKEINELRTMPYKRYMSPDTVQ
jgi:hypothetical protein